MTATPAVSTYPAYEAVPDLRYELASETVRTTNPSEAAREDLLIRKLGNRGWGRLHHFRHYYSQGWGEHGRGRPLSPRSLEAFFRFLEAMPQPLRGTPRVFLTDDGHLELVWKDAGGKAVQVEFAPTHTEFYVEADDHEGEVPHSDLSDLAATLPSA